MLELARLAGCGPEDILDFSASVNPLGTPERLTRLAVRECEQVGRYPEPRAESLMAAAARRFGVPSSRVLAGNGANQLLHTIPLAFGLKRAVIAAPAYGDYERACRNAKMEVVQVVGDEATGFVPDAGRLAELATSGTLVFIGNPGNPAGTALKPELLRQLATSCPEALFVVDEAFADFVEEPLSLLPEPPPNVLVVRSLTKLYAIPGLRAGLLVATEELLEPVARLVPDWSVNSIAVAVGAAALEDDTFVQTTREHIAQLRSRLAGQLRGHGMKVYDGLANYLLVRLPKTEPDFCERLLRQHRIAVRDCSGFAGLDDRYFRVGLRSEEDNDRLAEALSGGAFHAPRRRPKPALMLQGTSSDAGKSVLAAAFCRIMLQDGFDVAPFKAQNMSLNSSVTPDGGEIGRAQALQAEACRLDPDVRMNPVLLKPCSDTGAQVVVLGKPERNMRAHEYHSAKRRFFPLVTSAYDALAAEHEVMVLEGAGSPGEVNLKANDIVNMAMARHAASPVLLVGDIDRGGVYASFLGTYETFAPWERQLLRGYLVNKFRGDAALLAPAHDYLLERTGKPVLGVVPFLKDLRLPEEDSLSFGAVRKRPKRSDALDVALVIVGHIANFTDFAPLELEPDVKLRHVRKPEELGNPDLILLPGSKNTVADMEQLWSSGLAAVLLKQVESGAWLAGICGGLQFAGAEILDPHGIESDGHSAKGLGLLPLSTTMEKEKRLRLTRSVWEGLPVSGYEIHHGATTSADPSLVTMRDADGYPLGYASGRVWLSYLHGVFDNDQFRRAFLDRLRSDRGRAPLGAVQCHYEVESELNRLADTVRDAVDMGAIYQLMGLK